MPRSIWKGAVSFGLVTIPIRVYGATEANVTMMNRGNRPGSVGRCYPFQHGGARLAKLDGATGELARGADGRLIECLDGEPGELLGRVGRGLISYDGYVDREHWSDPRLIGRIHSSIGNSAASQPMCANEIDRLIDQYPDFFGRRVD